ncbi:quinone oxidoreductase family protein [Micromonospora parathelypteridis]|uniref:NADPH:quinone reductase-like Zn-dependent oxidoreductase n=1 Tax=Micromonospora parathelypteridis TaxID=1839617 RepID=A0A840VW49_9ACTN|nr:NADP-dependent oxidoreductase [Micromonospora parathelypteridis]MBB5478134.1 NADPH:quinone reductase-like Zn-dependent oxidoreductase [Micromonospora parathelypteridis]GGO07804.1 oxidoreductase [Micromonospora parathelypteridis]
MVDGDVPERMQAAAFDEFGGPEVITLRKLPIPQVADDEVLIKVLSAGVGVWDAYERQGVLVPEGSALPIVPGSDGAGTVTAAGRKVTDLVVGDLVYASATARPKGGFYAEYAAVKAQFVAKLPDGVPAEHAGAMSTDALTALAGLDTVSLSAGDWLLIFGASGGQGHLAVQLAKRQGLNVIAVASGADGVALVTRLGADVSLDGHGDLTDVLARIKDAAPAGVAAILAMASGKTLDRLTEALVDGGVVAYAHGVRPEPSERPGVVVRAYDGVANPRQLQRLNELIEAGPFVVHVAEKFPLGKVREAHKRLQTSYAGKLLLTVG